MPPTLWRTVTSGLYHFEAEITIAIQALERPSTVCSDAIDELTCLVPDCISPKARSTFRLELVVDFSTYRSNGSGGGCSLASGTLVFTKSAQGNPEELTMNHAGLVCDTDGIGSPKTYTATYHATGGTRKYFAALGTGDVAIVFDAADTLLHLDENILFR